MKIIVDTTRCTSSGRCAWYAPDIFGQNDDDGLAQVIKQDYTAEEMELIRDAVNNCPTAALSLVES